MIIYKYTKALIRSVDDNTIYIDIIAEVLQGDTLVTFIFIISKTAHNVTSIDVM